MQNQNWLIVSKPDGAKDKEAIKSAIMERWIKAKDKPKQVLIDRWVLGDELIEYLIKIGIPAEPVKFVHL